MNFCGAAWSFAHAKSPAGKDRAPCETAAHGLHKHEVSFPQPTVFEGGVEGERDRGRRRIAVPGDGLHDFFGDRKSTRLNSSHVKISYAVFCLKKKKIR